MSLKTASVSAPTVCVEEAKAELPLPAKTIGLAALEVVRTAEPVPPMM